MLRTSFLNHPSVEPKGHSMLIHTAGRIRDHEDDKKIVDNVLLRLTNHDTKLLKDSSTRLINPEPFKEYKF